MKNYLKVDDTNRQLVMDRTFAKNASIVGTREYDLLQSARASYPTYSVVKKTIKKNESKECYHGLTYDYMRYYIFTHEAKETVKAKMDEFEEMILISKCHSKGYRYPIIKQWFLDEYPEIKQFGMPKEVENKEAAYATPFAVADAAVSAEPVVEEVAAPAEEALPRAC